MIKKIVLCISAVCLFLSISACTTPDNGLENSFDMQSSTVNSTADPTETVTDGYSQPLPLLAVSLPVSTQTETAEDGTILFNYSFQNLSLILPDPDVADKVIVDFLNRIDQTAAEAESIRTAAISDCEDTSNWNPYLCQITYDPKRIDTGVLSMFGCYISYSGSVHAGAVYRSVSYDLVTGNALYLNDIFTETADPSQLYQLVLESLTAQKDSISLFDGFEFTVAERFGKNFRQDNDWFFSNQGLCYFFSPYEIGPYSSGVIIAEIPYSKLVGIIDDAYFPTEKVSVTGNIFLKSFDKVSQDTFSQFAEVILDEDGSKFLLYTDSSVYDICIEAGYWSQDDEIFTPEYTVFSAYGLSSDSAILVQSDVSDIHPTLRLSYLTGESIVYQYIQGDSLISAN